MSGFDDINLEESEETKRKREAEINERKERLRKQRDLLL